MSHVGVEASRDMAKWLWNSQFSACAGDSPSFEAIPKQSRGIQDLFLHEIMLGGWGMPIGMYSHSDELVVDGVNP